YFQGHPLLFANQVGDKSLQFGGVLNLVLSFSEDDAEHPRLFAKLRQDMTVMAFQVVPVQTLKARPIQATRDESRPIVRGFHLLIGHLQEKQEGQLLDVVPVREAVIAENVAVIPELLNNR